MTDVPLPALLDALFVFLILSGFLFGSETAMMAANRRHFRHALENLHRGAKRLGVNMVHTQGRSGVGTCVFRPSGDCLQSLQTMACVASSSDDSVFDQY
jgi:hypothetical protein